MASCNSCGTKIGFLKGLCEDCQQEARKKDLRETRDNLLAGYHQMAEEFGRRRPDLLDVWTKSMSAQGRDPAAFQAKLKTDDVYEWDEMFNAQPVKLEDSILDPIPEGDKVLALASGTNKFGNSDYCYWILTDRNVVIVRYGLMRRNEIRGSELVSLQQISGFEKQQTSRAANTWEIVMTRASNSDGILHVPDVVASEMIAAYNKARGDSSPASAVREKKDAAESIRNLKSLLDDGLISESEFEAKRQKLLDEI
jgi:hypothetical protein